MGEISQWSADISSNYRSNVSLICAIYRRDIAEISEEQSALFHDYHLHYFCTILYEKRQQLFVYGGTFLSAALGVESEKGSLIEFKTEK